MRLMLARLQVGLPRQRTFWDEQPDAYRAAVSGPGLDTQGAGRIERAA